jgi:DNA-binding NtrC family response regulator
MVTMDRCARSDAMTRVVAVDGDDAVLELFGLLLSGEGYEAVLCRRSAEAYQCVRDASADVVILDLDLDWKHSGLAILAALKADAALRTTPVIVCSTDAQTLRRHADFLQRHGCAVLLKPFAIDDVLVLIQQAIKHLDKSAYNRRLAPDRRAQQRYVAVERRSGVDRRRVLVAAGATAAQCA